jgi:hypothetical protein
MKKCKVCDYPLSEEEEAAGICETCFCKRLKELYPHVKFLRADGTETDDIEEAEYIQGIELKKDLKKTRRKQPIK